MLDREQDKIDFPYEINGDVFNQLYYFVDGIFPSLTHFLPTINDPIPKHDKFYAPKQEGFRLSIKQAFNGWKQKFLSVGHKTA